jgi:hypothetical protein
MKDRGAALPSERLLAWRLALLQSALVVNWNNQPFALVEFAAEAAAVKAVQAFTNPDSWWVLGAHNCRQRTRPS